MSLVQISLKSKLARSTLTTSVLERMCVQNADDLLGTQEVSSTFKTVSLMGQHTFPKPFSPLCNSVMHCTMQLCYNKCTSICWPRLDFYWYSTFTNLLQKWCFHFHLPKHCKPVQWTDTLLERYTQHHNEDQWWSPLSNCQCCCKGSYILSREVLRKEGEAETKATSCRILPWDMYMFIGMNLPSMR